jgi:hypothetical protein
MAQQLGWQKDRQLRNYRNIYSAASANITYVSWPFIPCTELITHLAPTLVTITVTMASTSSIGEVAESSSVVGKNTIVPISSVATSAAPAATTSCGVSGDFTLDVCPLRHHSPPEADSRSSIPYLNSLHPTTTLLRSLLSSIPTATSSSPLAGHTFHRPPLPSRPRTAAI